MDVRRHRNKVIRGKLLPDGTTQWVTQVKCRLGCCKGTITRGTLLSVKRHLDKQKA